MSCVTMQSGRHIPMLPTNLLPLLPQANIISEGSSKSLENIYHTVHHHIPKEYLIHCLEHLISRNTKSLQIHASAQLLRHIHFKILRSLPDFRLSQYFIGDVYLKDGIVCKWALLPTIWTNCLELHGQSNWDKDIIKL